MPEWISWTLLLACITQSAMFSGLNLAVFGVSRLRLEAEHALGHPAASRVLALRLDSNTTLATILWGNVAINVLLTMLADSVLLGVGAFVFSTFAITIFGEILPQSYFSRHAIRMAARLAPVLEFYKVLFYPVSKPTGLLLDRWLGSEAAIYWPEKSFRELIRSHVASDASDLSEVEGLGALNFLALDDIPVSKLGEVVSDGSILTLPHEGKRAIFPTYAPRADDPFLRSVQASGKPWTIILDNDGRPRSVLDADSFLRSALFSPTPVDPHPFCHRPIVVEDAQTLIGAIVSRFEVRAEHPRDYVIDDDVILVWSTERRIITGADLLGHLLKGVVVRTPHAA